MNHAEPCEPLLTVKELCGWLKVKPATVYDWVYRGKIPHLKVGVLLRFRMSEIDQWLTDQRQN